jgi:hypothetical protein
MTDNTKVLDRIKKLFNLAQGNSNENEAQTALLMAQKLMAENNIEESMVIQNEGSFTGTKKSVVQGAVISGSTIPWWKKSLGVIIANNFKCECFVRKAHREQSFIFFGLKDDVILAKIAFDFACEAIESSCKAYVKKCKQVNPYVNVAGLKNDYIIGWTKGIKDQFAEQVKKNNWGLVLVKDALVIHAKEKMNLTKGRRSTIRCNNNQDARAEGYKNGKSFNVTAKRLA